jgi:hypothetical protein
MSAGASLVVAFGAVQKGAAAESMTLREYLWRGHDPTAVAVLMEVCVNRKYFQFVQKLLICNRNLTSLVSGTCPFELNDGGLLEFYSTILLLIVV